MVAAEVLVANLKKVHAEEAVAPAGYGRLVQGTLSALTVDPALPSVSPPRARQPRYQTPLPWQLPPRGGDASAARSALTLAPMMDPPVVIATRRRPT